MCRKRRSGGELVGGGGGSPLKIFIHSITQYVYVIISKKDNELYIGCTKDLKERLKLHNAKKVDSTKKRVPLALIYYEAYINPIDAFNREKYMKTRYGRNYLHKTLNNFFMNKNFIG